MPPTATVTQSVTVSLNDDNLVELTETFLASLSVAALPGGRTIDVSDTATGTIDDNDSPTFTIDDVTVDEDDGTATFTVSLSNPIDIDVDVDVSYGSGSATGGGVDYDDSVDTVTFLANTTTPQTVTVSINNDGLVEATETFVASLSTTTNLGGRNVNLDDVDTGVGTINDDDSARYCQSMM